MSFFFLSFSGLEVVHSASFHLHNGAAHSDFQESAERGSSSGDKNRTSPAAFGSRVKNDTLPRLSNLVTIYYVC